MSIISKKSSALFLLGFAYAFLFHEAELGLNLFLFDALLLLLALWARPELGKHRGFIWSVAGLLFAAGSVVIVHGSASIFVHHLTYFLVLGFAQARELRFVWFGLLIGLISLFQGPFRWGRQYLGRLTTSQREGAIASRLKGIRHLVLPVIIVVPFLLFYLTGNSRFADGVGWLINLIPAINFNQAVGWNLLLFTFALLLTAGLFFVRSGSWQLVRWQNDFEDALHRRRAPRTPTQHLRGRIKRVTAIPSKMMALKHEHQRAILTFGALNILLALVNATDLRFVWLTTAELPASTLSHYVHVGTYNLIFSIFLAMAVVFYFFRGNLNFYPNSQVLRPLARLWIAQNALLAGSVGVRNWHYIDAYGLAIGRVYVGLVLLLILFGLFTLLRKINRRLSLSFLLQTNGMALWLSLLIFGAVNWTNVITRYNLAQEDTAAIDWHHLSIFLDDRNLFLINQHPHLPPSLKKDPKELHWRTYKDWRSWNYPDWRNKRWLE
ncbi:MAG: DUF4173 domain-containing protein [Bacteroidota bacterium]